ncbi:FtsW/RodA/SpoVE family cell cycle protein [Anaerotignum lactatifermentans]|uniref:FtsW/RodA/SpoVE family cell cycle protein n=1 Tax=Anaerotignum lactatifermentans TaxID=160404 RepID=A0ABS2G6H6_9FIRM|nr:FtsW/RodA/SpoVE family cell cycle protein [Anaerotignum lactatifermentans]MBM6876630.1 FtsW/RodA/SpoVE family cell cycle protein [Anaerotignum lactatifermentans]MBM6949790.1 FtsW/RodA/SpoVE family cell cycle protein [Anaerotignum lactatifermentans]
MFDLVVMLSRYLFVIYIGLFLWEAIVYIAYEQGGYLGSPYRAVSIQRRLVVLMHLTAFLILSYDTQTHLFHWQALVFGAVSLAFILVAIQLLDRFYYEGCPLIWTGMLFLMDVSLIILHRVDATFAYKQLLWMAIGLAGMLLLPSVLRLIPRFEVFEWAYIIVCYGLLLLTQIVGVEHGGSQNWLQIGSISFQPSEIAKFLFVFYLASVFRKRVELREFLITAVLSAGVVALLVLQKDLGSALIFFMTYMAMLYIATSNEILVLLGMGSASLASVIAYKLFSHVRVRVAAWRDPWADIDSGGYQIVTSLFAITTYGLFGSGLTKGMPVSIPVVESDCIFAAICEEMGVLFGAGIICIFIMILYRGIRITLDCTRRYYSLLAVGVIVMLSFQAFLIIGGVIKLIPLTGVTLPLVSYGGSSVLVSLMMMGILQWVCVYCEQHNQAAEEQRMQYLEGGYYGDE